MFSLCVSGAAIALSVYNLVSLGRAMRRLGQREAQLQAELRQARALWVRK